MDLFDRISSFFYDDQSRNAFLAIVSLSAFVLSVANMVIFVFGNRKRLHASLELMIFHRLLNVFEIQMRLLFESKSRLPIAVSLIKLTMGDSEVLCRCGVNAIYTYHAGAGVENIMSTPLPCYIQSLGAYRGYFVFQFPPEFRPPETMPLKLQVSTNRGKINLSIPPSEWVGCLHDMSKVIY